MPSLFINIIDLDEIHEHVICSLQTAIVLFFCQYVNVPIILVLPQKINEKPNTFKFSVKNIRHKTILENNLPRPAADCLLPVFQNDNGSYCTAGFCSSLRMVCVYLFTVYT